MVPSRKMVRAHGGCLGTGSRRRTRQAAIVPGERHTRFDPGVSEWENPPGPTSWQPPPEHIRRGRATGGTETSKYPEEEKSNEIPLVAASERGPTAKPAAACSARALRRRGCGASDAGGPRLPPARRQSGSVAERQGKAGETGLWPRRRNRDTRAVARPEYRRTRETRWEAGGTTLQA